MSSFPSLPGRVTYSRTIMMKKSRTFDAILRLRGTSDSGTPTLVRPVDEQIELWWDQYADILYRGLKSRFGWSNAQHADDAVNEAYLRLYKALLNGKSIDNPRAWLCTVAHNEMVTELRRARADRAGRDDLASFVSTRVATPDDIVREQRKQLVLAREWLMLSEIERVCLELRASGKKFGEIGAIVGLDRRRVAEIVASATERLAEKIGE